MPAQVYAYYYMRCQRHTTMAAKELRALLAQHGFSIAHMASWIREDGQVFEDRMVIRTTDPTNTSRLADDLRQLESVREFRISPTGG
jgi:putative Mg2+ transporter-C (MgtC) family protein